MKIVAIDNHGNETVADRLVAENIKSEIECQIMLKALQDTCTEGSCSWYISKNDEDKLWRGMEELV